ncbi:MAG: glycosyl transferase, partial [Cytophagaceae bacterium]|nr:glycosyl transferase [Cytophagaceae bacterium]
GQRWLHRALVNQVTHLTSIGTTRRLALSFYDFPDALKSRIFVVPPLLRAEVLGAVRRVDEAFRVGEASFLLAYTTHHRLAEDLIAWNKAHPQTRIEAFWDNPDADESWAASPTLTFHRINAERFLDAMRRCRGLVSTAGFEAICEAMYLDKPVMMLPVPGHFEQACNAYDAERAGAGLRATSFTELDRFLDYLPRHQSVQAIFRHWQGQTVPRFLQHLTDAFGDAPARIPRLIRWSGRWLRR